MLGRLFLATAAVVCALAPVPESQDVTPAQEATPFAPRRYVAYRTPAPIVSDGRLAEPAWAAAPWTDAFVDIEGDSRPRPPLQTRVKMLWDDSNFYVAAEMEEPDLWGTLKQRDAVIFHDNDFEVFIDPDGDTHAYYELEVNVLGTPWDLMLLKPYRDGGPRHRRVGHCRPPGRHRRSWHRESPARSRRRLDDRARDAVGGPAGGGDGREAAAARRAMARELLTGGVAAWRSSTADTPRC